MLESQLDVPTTTECSRLHAGGVVSRHRDHWRAGGPALARCASCPRIGAADEVPEQYAAVRFGGTQFSRCESAISQCLPPVADTSKWRLGLGRAAITLHRANGSVCVARTRRFLGRHSSGEHTHANEASVVLVSQRSDEGNQSQRQEL